MEHRRREPAPGIFRMVLPLPFEGLDRVNAYLLADGDSFVLVDCGIYNASEERDHGWQDVVEALKACDATPEEIRLLVLTHPHIDHYGMAGRIMEVSGCELWMHAAGTHEVDLYYRHPEAIGRELDAMLIEHGVDPEDVGELTAYEDWRGFVSSVVDPTRELVGDETFEVGGRAWRVVHTPGHSAAHICLYSEGDGYLISGDHLLGSVTPHIDFKRGDTDPLGDFLESLEKIEALAPDVVFPGHGRPFEDGAARARAVARHHDRRLGSILQVIRREPRSASEITDEIFGTSLLNFQRRLAFGEALAHLAYLRRRGEIERFATDDGRFLYRKAPRKRTEDDD